MQSLFKKLPRQTSLRQQSTRTALSWQLCKCGSGAHAYAACQAAVRGSCTRRTSHCTRETHLIRPLSAQLRVGRCRTAVRDVESVVATPEPLALRPGEVHIWWIHSDEVRSATLQEQYLHSLPAEEKEYVLQGANAETRKERLLARTLVRLTLARYCRGNIAPSELCFESSPNGKPWLVREQGCTLEGRRLHFNLTHTDQLLGVAVTRERFVGLDAESTSRLTRSDPLRLARRRFSEQEIAVLEGFDNARERAAQFMRLWTLKEAYVKATGRGISAAPGLKAFTFELLLQTSAKAARRDRRNGSGPDAGASNGSGRAMRHDSKAHPTPQEAGGRAVVQMRLPFWIRFAAAASDSAEWEAVLMDVSGGHTAALVVGGRTPALEPEAPLSVRIFKTVPMVFEEEADELHYRLIGYGRST